MANMKGRNKANKVSGIVGARLQGAPEPTSLKKKNVAGLPMKPPMDSPNARLKPTTTHKTLTMPAATTLLIIVEITFFRCTIPP